MKNKRKEVTIHQNDPTQPNDRLIETIKWSKEYDPGPAALIQLSSPKLSVMIWNCNFYECRRKRFEPENMLRIWSLKKKSSAVDNEHKVPQGPQMVGKFTSIIYICLFQMSLNIHIGIITFAIEMHVSYKGLHLFAIIFYNFHESQRIFKIFRNPWECVWYIYRNLWESPRISRYFWEPLTNLSSELLI